MFKTNRQLRRLLQESVAREEGLSDQMYIKQVELEAADLDQQKRNEAFHEFLGALRDTMGGNAVFTCEAEALERLREIRAHADLYASIREVLAGRFDADATLLKRLACSLGTSSFDQAGIIQRAGHLSQMKSTNARLERESETSRRTIEDLEETVEALKYACDPHNQRTS